MSSAPPRWRRLPEARPSQILTAALEVFGEQGLAGARIDEIARRAGLSKGTLYHYFPSKEALFRELVRDMVRGSTVELLPSDAGGPASELLRASLAGLWARVDTPGWRTLYRMLLAELPLFPDLAEFYGQEISGQTVRFVAALVRRGVEAGEFRAVDPMAAARMLMALLGQNGVWSGQAALYTHAAGRSHEQVGAEIEEMFFAALRPLPPA